LATNVAKQPIFINAFVVSVW